MMTICMKNVPFLAFMEPMRPISTQPLACMLCNIVVKKRLASSPLMGGIFMRIAALVMSVKILMPDRLKCRLYVGMWRLGIIAIRQVAKPMP